MAPPGVLLKLGMGCAASAMSRLRRGALTAASSASAGVADGSDGIAGGSNGRLAMLSLDGGGGCGVY